MMPNYTPDDCGGYYMTVFTFVFVAPNGEEHEEDIWSITETRAWYEANEYASENGYDDFYSPESGESKSDWF